MGNYGETDEEKVLKGVVRVELGMILLILCTYTVWIDILSVK